MLCYKKKPYLYIEYESVFILLHAFHPKYQLQELLVVSKCIHLSVRVCYNATYADKNTQTIDNTVHRRCMSLTASTLFYN